MRLSWRRRTCFTAGGIGGETPFDEASFDAQARLIDALHRRYLDMKHLEIISRREDYRIARGYLYNSPVHPGRAGREIRTRQVMADLEKWRANSL